jgi:hypothetical protein
MAKRIHKRLLTRDIAVKEFTQDQEMAEAT